jgi:hypothetical protein
MKREQFFRKKNLLRTFLIFIFVISPSLSLATLGGDPSLPFNVALYDQYNTSDAACFEKFTAICGAEGMADCSLFMLSEVGILLTSADPFLGRSLFFLLQSPHRGPPVTHLHLSETA